MMRERISRRALRIALVLGQLVLAGACHLGGGDGDVSCDPPPRITSSPPVEATVGRPYSYTVEARYVCGFALCGDVVWEQVAPGASAADRGVYWVPSQDQANQDFRFIVATPQDSCGDSARQSWEVHVLPAPP